MLAPFERYPENLQGKERAPYSYVKGLRRNFGLVANSYIQALPLELGEHATSLLKKLNKLAPLHLAEKMPLPDELFANIRAFINPFAITNCDKNKSSIYLTKKELNRQAHIINSYLEQGHANHVLGLIREWIVSSSMLAQEEQGEVTVWLTEESRKDIEDKLNSMAKALEGKKKSEQLSAEQKLLAKQWQYLSQRRNDLHHHGIKLENALLGQAQLSEIAERWQKVKDFFDGSKHWHREILCQSDGVTEAKKEPAVKKTLLISPLGLSKGLLYSALSHVGPDSIFVISSQNAVDDLDEIANQSVWSGNRDLYLMRDPFTGFDEKEAVFEQVLPLIKGSQKIVVNITGGTTAMQHIMQQIASLASQADNNVQRIALVDRRSPAEQRDNPYVLGEVIWLDD